MTEKTEYRQSRFVRPPGATELLLVRHGESRAATDENPFPMTDGRGDPELHPNGVAQAQRVGERLARLEISAVYVTSLRRTHETAAPLCDRLAVTPLVEPALREVCLGEWEGGLFRRKAHEQDPLYLRMHAEQRWDVIPGGEPHHEIEARVQPALRRINAAHPDSLVVAVVHGGIIGHILARATGAAPFAFHGADNGSISHVILHEGLVRLRRFNDTSHLGDSVSAAPGQYT